VILDDIALLDVMTKIKKVKDKGVGKIAKHTRGDGIYSKVVGLLVHSHSFDY
jgi:hypothetical protein